ncbi:MAG: putative maltokinase, partial [Gammaproteobacteria bacterium]
NTTIILGDHLFLKGYRRLRPGLNPEIEVGRFLTDVSPFPSIAPLLGTLVFEARDGARLALAMVQAYRANQGDAWIYSVGYLRRFLEDTLTNPPQEVQPAELHAVYLMLMRTLGLRTAELHRALAQRNADPAFDPEPITGADLKCWTRQVRDEARFTLKVLNLRRRELALGLRELVDRLLAMQKSVPARIANLRLNKVHATKTRYHGDYHLGQALIAENDFILIDFEGEPARTLEERRRKHSPLRDVAAMLRSLNYAAYNALAAVTAERSHEIGRLEPLVREWERLAAEAFLSGYREGIAGCSSYPDDPQHARALIELFTLEKAFYELRYELENRPEWVAVPLQGLNALFGESSSQ